MTELRSFRKITNKERANDLVELLTDNNILCKLIEIAPALDSNFGGAELTKFYEVQINKSDFERANALLESDAEQSIEIIDEEHYLLDFTNEELYEILLKPDEWSEYDYKLASKILINRGENVGDDLLRSLREQRIKDLEKPEESQKSWIYLGYLFSILGGFLGMFMGWHIWKGTKTLPDGRKVYTYNKSDREHGRIIFVIGVIVFPIVFIFRMITEI